MSCYEWERGSIKIPAKEWSAFRRAIITGYNRLEDERYAEALLAHAKILAAKKGKRGFNTYRYANYDLELPEHIMELLFTYNQETAARSFNKPKKKNLNKKPLGKDCYLDVGDEAGIYFTSKTRTVEWDVPENNRACEAARRHPLAKLFFRRLDGMTWTRGSGGKIIGNNEYNRDSGYEGGGGNMLIEQWPKSK